MSDTVIGKVVAGCRIIEMIGKGGMGVVYKAHHLALKKDRAIKVMDPHLSRDATFMRRFRDEAVSLAQAESSNIVIVHDLAEETEIGTCIIMEYVPGQSLAALIREPGETLSHERIIHLFDQILHAFEDAHKAGVIHRDVKPSNILVGPGDKVKVVDFGLAKRSETTVGSATRTATELTGGTLFYMSPEQLEQRKVDHRSDLYSIGMTLYETLTGAVPFDQTRESRVTIEHRIVQGMIPAPRRLNSQIHPALNDLVVKAIAANPDKRFQSAKEMREVLNQIRLIPPPPPQWKKYGLIAGGILAIAAITYLIIPPRLQTGWLTITVNPHDAQILIGDTLYGGRLDSIEFTTGSHRIKVERAGYFPQDTNVIVRPEELLSIFFSLVESDKGWLAISVSPSDAAVFVDGNRYTGKLDNVTVGANVWVTIRCEKMGYEPQEQRFSVRGGQRQQAVFSLVPARAWVGVAITPADAVIFLNGSLYGGRRDSILVEPRVPLAVRAERSGYSAQSRNLTPVSGELRQLTFLLKPLSEFSYLQVSDPDIVVRIDGEPRTGSSPVRTQPGTRLVELFKDGRLRWKETIMFEAGQTVQRSIDFNKTIELSIQALDVAGEIVNDANIWVDGRPHNRPTPTTIPVPAGFHAIRVGKIGYHFELKEGNYVQDTPIPFTLRRE